MNHLSAKSGATPFVVFCTATLFLVTGCVSDSPSTGVSGQPSAVSPIGAFGEAHPDAPPQITEFGQFAGRWQCGASERRADGSWRTRPDKINWTFFYTLNGMAVQDIWTSDDQLNKQEGIATNLRVFNPRTQSWNTAWTNTLEASFELWTGGMIGNEMVLTSVREGRPVKIRFFNVIGRQFQWTYEAATTTVGNEFVPVMQLLCQRQN